MAQRILLAAAALCLGFGAGAVAVNLLGADDPAAGTSNEAESASVVERLRSGLAGDLDREQLEQVVDALVQVLDDEIAERRVLAEQLEATRTELHDLQQNLRARVEAAFEMSEEQRDAARAAAVARRSSPENGRSVDSRLEAAGFTPDQVAYLQGRQAEAEMQWIELDDRARREGWFRTPRYDEEMADLPNGTDVIRSELGDDAYAKYLFASGRPNRIAVGSVIRTSPAERAGLQPGDIILTYAGEQVFSSQELTDLRSSGELGTPVAVGIIRDGQAMLVSMPRGPMGVQLQPIMFDPDLPGG